MIFFPPKKICIYVWNSSGVLMIPDYFNPNDAAVSPGLTHSHSLLLLEMQPFGSQSKAQHFSHCEPQIQPFFPSPVRCCSTSQSLKCLFLEEELCQGDCSPQNTEFTSLNLHLLPDLSAVKSLLSCQFFRAFKQIFNLGCILFSFSHCPQKKDQLTLLNLSLLFCRSCGIFLSSPFFSLQIPVSFQFCGLLFQSAMPPQGCSF